MFFLKNLARKGLKIFISILIVTTENKKENTRKKHHNPNLLNAKRMIKKRNPPNENYRQVSNIRRTFVCNYIVDHSYVVGASPVGAAPTTSSFST